VSTSLHDLPNANLVAAAFPPAAVTDAVVGQAVDLADTDGPAFAVQLIGDVSDDGSLTGQLDESADGTTWAAVAGGAFAAADAPGTQTLRFTPTARYVRWAATVSGPTPEIDAAVVIVRGKKLF
jgi:hypothetical protein